jgi:hypothetical protein
MWVWDEAGNGAEERERLDFEMGGGGYDVRLVKRDICVVLLIDV